MQHKTAYCAQKHYRYYYMVQIYTLINTEVSECDGLRLYYVKSKEIDNKLIFVWMHDVYLFKKVYN